MKAEWQEVLDAVREEFDRWAAGREDRIRNYRQISEGTLSIIRDDIIAKVAARFS